MPGDKQYLPILRKLAHRLRSAGLAHPSAIVLAALVDYTVVVFMQFPPALYFPMNDPFFQ
jgi:hypothetical protein